MSSAAEIEQLRRELEQERREKEQIRREKEQEQREHQNTTLEEYLYDCHFDIYNRLKLAKKTHVTTGFTNVDGKYYPKWLRPWDSFETTHRQRHFDTIRRACQGKRLFDPASSTRHLGAKLTRTPASNENAVHRFEKLGVEESVWEILRPVWEDKDLCREYQCTGLEFTDNRLDVTMQSDDDQATDPSHGTERQERRSQTGPNKRVATEQRVKTPPTNPDGWGVRTRLSGDESHAFVFDYKAAHKIDTESVKSAVSKETLFMEVIQRMNSNKYQSDDKLREGERKEELIAMALTQVFDYMVRYEVVYGYVVAGKTLLFLHVDRSDLQTLYCHACVPQEDVDAAAGENWAEHQVMYTAVAQLASFCLLSLLSEALRGAALEATSEMAAATLKKWRDPYEYEDAPLRAGTEETESSTASSSSSQETDPDFTSSVGPTGRKISLRSKSSCRAAEPPPKKEDEEDGLDGCPSGSRPRTDSAKQKDRASSSSPVGEKEDSGVSDSAPTRQYCTQKCLLGLKRGGELDDDCPNASLHCTAEGGGRGKQHPIDAAEFTRRVSEQLKRDPYYKCDALDRWRKTGAIGVLFKLELVPYGYTLVGKGTFSGRPDDLEHEGRIYDRLEVLQGYVIPVHLGLATLGRGHLIAGGTRVFQLMLMSWAGEMATEDEVLDLAGQVKRTRQAVWDNGVYHGDEDNSNNLLWNEERRCVMLVDFDRAVLRPRPQSKRLREVTSKTRKRATGEPKRRNSLKRFPVQGRS